jgi:hypothetical protein
MSLDYSGRRGDRALAGNGNGVALDLRLVAGVGRRSLEETFMLYSTQSTGLKFQVMGFPGR